MKIETKHHVNLEKFSVKELRQRLFVKQSEALYGKAYSYVDDVPEQIEMLDGFISWESFSKTWDIYWAGLDPRSLKWVAGRHNSPFRSIVTPVRILPKDERNGRMLETHLDKDDLKKLEVPIKQPLEESDEDRAISESLSGKVIIDETDTDKAIRLIEKNMELLQSQLKLLTDI